jgi:hypothetical protein
MEKAIPDALGQLLEKTVETRQSKLYCQDSSNVPSYLAIASMVANPISHLLFARFENAGSCSRACDKFSNDFRPFW